MTVDTDFAPGAPHHQRVVLNQRVEGLTAVEEAFPEVLERRLATEHALPHVSQVPLDCSLQFIADRLGCLRIDAKDERFLAATEELEGALAGRPGRIDQAIEVPLPDQTGRRKLVQLYGKSLQLDEAIIDEAVQRTDGASAAFIKELMRRVAQAGIVRTGGASIVSSDLRGVLDDMLFTGSKLNVRLLGGAQPMRA